MNNKTLIKIIALGAVALLIILGAVFILRKRKKKGCSCGCGSCPADCPSRKNI